MQFYRLLESPRLVEENPYNRVHVTRRHSDRITDYWVLGLIVAGELELCVGEERGRVETGQYYLLPPNVRHYGTEEAEFIVVYFHFMAAGEICDARDAGALPIYGAIPTHLKVNQWFDFLLGAADFGLLDENGWNLQLGALLDQLYLGARGADALAPNEQLVASALDYLRANALQPLNQAHLSSTLGYSYDHLDRLFRKRFGMTLYRRHCELRFDQAVALLQTGHSLKQTARAIGFDDYYHFLKAFKRERGCSPGQFFK